VKVTIEPGDAVTRRRDMIHVVVPRGQYVRLENCSGAVGLNAFGDVILHLEPAAPKEKS